MVLLYVIKSNTCWFVLYICCQGTVLRHLMTWLLQPTDHLIVVPMSVVPDVWMSSEQGDVSTWQFAGLAF